MQIIHIHHETYSGSRSYNRQQIYKSRGAQLWSFLCQTNQIYFFLESIHFSDPIQELLSSYHFCLHSVQR